MLIEKADMLDALLGNFAGMDLLTDAAEGNCVVLGYVTGWLDALGTLIHVEKKKQDERGWILRHRRGNRRRTRENCRAGRRGRGALEVRWDRGVRENGRRW